MPSFDRGPFLIRAAIACALFLATLALYAPVRRHGFVSFDDPGYVYRNEHVLGGVTRENVGWAFSSTEMGNWHPLTWISHMADAQLFGLDAGAHHRTSAILHAGAAVLLFLAFSAMTHAVWRSALVAALFALHPLHVESVAWISERKDVLSTILALLALLAWARYARRPSASSYLAALAFFALGLMAKPMLVTLPYLLLLFDFWPLERVRAENDEDEGSGRRMSRLLVEKIPFFALSAVSAIVTFIAQRSGAAVQSLETIPLAARLQNAALAYATYVRRTLWPTDLAHFYPYPTQMNTGAVLLAVLFLVTASLLVLLVVRTRPYLAFSWLWFLGTLVPVLGLVQVGRQALADRYTYLPIVGLFIALAWGLGELAEAIPRGRIVAPAVAIVLLAACAAIAAQQVRFWENDRTLAERALAVTSGNYVAQDTLAAVLLREGHPDQAIPHHREALRLNPGFLSARINLGVALAQLGRHEEAIAEYREVLVRNPRDVEALVKLGISLGRIDRQDEGERALRRALAVDPDDLEAHANLGMLLESSGNLREAAEHYRACLQREPRNVALILRLAQVTSKLEAAEGAAGESP